MTKKERQEAKREEEKEGRMKEMKRNEKWRRKQSKVM